MHFHTNVQNFSCMLATLRTWWWCTWDGVRKNRLRPTREGGGPTTPTTPNLYGRHLKYPFKFSFSSLRQQRATLLDPHSTLSHLKCTRRRRCCRRRRRCRSLSSSSALAASTLASQKRGGNELKERNLGVVNEFIVLLSNPGRWSSGLSSVKLVCNVQCNRARQKRATFKARKRNAANTDKVEDASDLLFSGKIKISLLAKKMSEKI